MARTTFRDSGGGDNRDWAPQVDVDGAPRRVADPTKDFIEGHLLKKKENVGKNASNVYEIKISPDPNAGEYTGFGEVGEVITVWGSKSSGSNNVLDKQMDAFLKHASGGLGAWCRIEFNGRELKKEAEGKKPAQIAPSDLVILYTVIGDDEIPAIKVDAPAAYKAAPTNAAPVKKEEPAKTAAPVKEVPASIDETDDPESDDLPF